MSSTSIDLEALALAHGTPLFVYDLDRVRLKAERARRALGPEVWLAYALKANPHPRIAEALSGIVSGLDVSSAPEIDTALAAGFEGHELVFSGPAKSSGAIRRAAAVGARITAEAIDQLERIRSVAPTARVALRINPSRRFNAYRVAMGGVPSPFGIDESMLDRARDLAPPHVGIQVFVGSDVSSVGGVMAAVVHTLDVAERIDGVDWVSFGGGLAIDFPIEQLGPKLKTTLAKFRKATRTDPACGFELGRHLVGDSGLYAARVVSVKRSHGETFVILDGGMNHNLFGMGIVGGPPKSVVNVSNPEGEPVQANVHGPLCTPLDRFVEPVMISRPRVGDLIAVRNVGAYGLSASPAAFIGYPFPAEVFVADASAT